MNTSTLLERFNRSASGSLRQGRSKEGQQYDEKRPDAAKRNGSQWHWYMQNTFLGKKPLAAILITVTTILAALFVTSYSAAPTRYLHHHHHQRHDHHGVGSRPQPKYLQLLIPTNRMSDVDLCKTILTAQILNYPVPVVIPWGNSSNGSPVAKRARMQSKVAHIYEYLKSLPVEMDDAITILLDGPDTWFQLRPDQFLQQYFQIMARANSRLRKQYGDEQVVEQKLLFAAQDSCASKDTAGLACFVPESPRQGGPKYLGNGAIIGQTKHLRALLKRAYGIVQRAPPNKLITTYSEIFGQQEYQREALRLPRSPTPKKGLKHHLGLAKRLPDEVPKLTPLPTMMHNETYEFGIGLDYFNNIGFATSLGADKIDWRTQHPLTTAMVASSIPPFWTVSGSEPRIPHTASWSDVSLLTVKATDTIPAMIHHQPTAPKGTDTTHMRRDWWKKLWLQPHARALYTNAEQMPATAVAAVRREEDGQEEVYWNRHTWTDKAGAWLPGDEFSRSQETWSPGTEFSRWQDMCGAEGQWQKIFGDGEGPWVGMAMF